jgi:hypothetical protein
METVVVVCLALGIVILLVQLRALRQRIDGLAPAVWRVASKEAEARDKREIAALAEATKKKATLLVANIQGYHDQIAADFRAQIKDAKARAQTTEQRAGDAGVALDAACALVTQARALTERLAALTPADPSLRAAALTTRPTEPRREVPTKPPPPHAPPKKATLLGIRPPPPVALPRAIEEEEGERASEEEITKVADRPKVAAVLAKTLASMQAVPAPEKKDGAA